MFAIITTDEYKDLLMQGSLIEELEVKNKILDKELTETREMLDKFLLLLTGGKRSTGWSDGHFEWVDISDKSIIAEYINENFFENGKLKLRSVSND